MVKSNQLRLIVNLFAFFLLVVLVVAYFSGWLGEYPARTLHLFSGRIAMIFLLASLSITPLRTITGSARIGPLRKAFGLNAFYYAALHLVLLFGLTYQFKLNSFFEAVLYRKNIWAGALAFIILAVLAVTSIRKVKTLLKKSWKKIHTAVYPAGALVMVHYAMSANISRLPGEPLKVLPILAAVYLTALFILRVKPVMEALIRRRGNQTGG